MADKVGSVWASGIGKIPHCDSKEKLAAKRGGGHLDEDSDSSIKRVNMRDLRSVLQSKGIDNHDLANSKMAETEEYMDIVETQSSQVADNTIANADARDFERESSKPSTLRKPLDLNSDLCTDENSGYNDTTVPVEYARNNSSYVKDKEKQKSSSGINFDLNGEDVASSAIQDPFYGHRSHSNVKTRETLECGRSTGRLEEKEALMKWKEMKQNGFISPSYGGIPAAPKQRGRKSKKDVLKQRMEQAKKEQVDRFTKIAAPSGLLNGLNPGIINHVRNSKQVHSIIQALVRSEIKASQRQASELKAGIQEPIEKSTELENTSLSGIHGSSLSYDVASFGSTTERKLMGGTHLSYSSASLLSSEDKGGCQDCSTEEGRLCAKPYFSSHPKNNSEDDILALKLSSSTMVSESTSCVSNAESENVNSTVDTLSVKAGTVASQWLQLLQQDIKGRLAALRRSKKRVHDVITTELPFLILKEFSSSQENDCYIKKDSAVGCPSNAIAELHRAKWSQLFIQMDSALCEEEKHLEHLLEQVNQMQVHCDQGLQHVQWNTLFEMQRLGAIDNQFRSKLNDQEKDLAVRAAAASIYSTCNFQSSREDVSCC